MLSASTGNILIEGEKLAKPIYAVGSAVSGVDIPGDEAFHLYNDWYWKNDPLNMIKDRRIDDGNGSVVIPEDGIYHCTLHLWSDWTPSKESRISFQILINNVSKYEHSARF